MLRHLLLYEPATGVALINLICGHNQTLSISREEASSILIDTQVLSRGSNTLIKPDMCIRNMMQDYLLYVEVKHQERDSEKDLFTKLTNYVEVIGENSVARRGVSLISRHMQPEEALPKDDRRFAGQVRWSQVGSILKGQSPYGRGEVTSFLVRGFIRLLKEKGMTLERVDSTLVPGLQALSHLKQMMQDVLDGEKLQPRSDPGLVDGYHGYIFYSKNRLCSLGLWIHEPDLIWFYVHYKRCHYVPSNWEKHEEQDWYGTHLSLTETGFFQKKENDQRNTIDGFVKRSIGELDSARTKLPKKVRSQ